MYMFVSALKQHMITTDNCLNKMVSVHTNEEDLNHLIDASCISYLLRFPHLASRLRLGARKKNFSHDSSCFKNSQVEDPFSKEIGKLLNVNEL